VAALSRYLQFDTTNRPADAALWTHVPFVLERAGVDRVHGVDERLSVENLALGVRVACDVIRALCVA
jgi:acetylornithine deacetylase/succinyl-diaminopimelate desuccinylase-like protein